MVLTLTYDDTALRTMLNAIPAKLVLYTRDLFAFMEGPVMEEIHVEIPYDEIEHDYYASLGNADAMARHAQYFGHGLHEKEPNVAAGEFHMEDHLFFLVNPENPQIAYVGTDTGMSYPLKWHEEEPPSGFFSKEGAKTRYIIDPLLVQGTATLQEFVVTNAGRLFRV